MFRNTLMAAILAATSTGAVAAVSTEEAAQLGKSLTLIGAERAGNKAGTIPEWTGGLTQVPADFKAGSGVRPDPYAADKPRLVITGKNADEHKEQLTAITYALLKRHPTMRVDVYPTRRPVVYPEKIQQNTVKNASQAKAVDAGLGFENALPGYPFPIPKNGNEAMWNHLLRYGGVASTCKYDSYNIDSAGVASLSTTGNNIQEWPVFAPANLDKPMTSKSPFWFIKQEYTGPARRAGEALVLHDFVSPLAQPRKAWQYLPGQRRVKLAPEIAYDTPNPGVAGAATYDDAFVFNGAMDRYDFKLLGKREMIIPYNAYKAVYFPGSKANVTTPKVFNPDLLRWELHRVWVVEATLKPGKRHIYQKRTFYLDEDSWVAVASDSYDGRGQLYRGVFAPVAFAYDAQTTQTAFQLSYDLVAGQYASQGNCGLHYGTKFRDPFPARDWTADSLAGAGVR
jgi:hypothetical protein